MPHWSPDSERKPEEGDTFTNERGTFRIVTNENTCVTYKNDMNCDYEQEGMQCDITCDAHRFLLLTEINYLTHRLTK